jgi:hypothetical protein
MSLGKVPTKYEAIVILWKFFNFHIHGSKIDLWSGLQNNYLGDGFFFSWKHMQYYAPALIDTGFFVPNCILLKIHASTSLVKRDFMWTSQQTRIYCHYQSCYFNLHSLCSWTCSNYLLAKCHIHKEMVSRKSSVKTSKEFRSFQVYWSGLKICWRVVVVQALETPYLFNLLVHSYQTLPSLNWSEKHCNLT